MSRSIVVGAVAVALMLACEAYAQWQEPTGGGPAVGDAGPAGPGAFGGEELPLPVPPPPAGQEWEPTGGRRSRWEHAQSQPSAEEMQEVLELLKEQDPQLAERLEAMRQSDPQRAQQMLRPHVPGLMRLVYLKRTDPEHFRLRMQDIKLERQSRELAQQIRALSSGPQSSEQQVNRLRGELAVVLDQQFEVRQQLQEKMVQELQQRLERLRQEVEQRKGQKDQLIEQRLEDLLKRDEGPKW